MLINNSKQMLVWQPFKNYSTSLLNYLCCHKVFKHKKFIFAQGPVPYFVTDVSRPEHEPSLGHTNWLSKRTASYTKVLPIRNPYNRTVSQWKHAIKTNPSLSFDDWLMIHSKQLIKFPVTKIYEYDILLRVEDIENGLRELNLFKDEHPFPHSNKSDDIDFTLTQYHKDMIYYLHYSDFIEGGYDK